MLKFKCPKCKSEKKLHKATYKYTDEGFEICLFDGKVIECGNCESVAMESVPRDNWNQGTARGGYLKIKSMSPADRAAVLDKRSQEHFKKDGREMKHEALKKAGLDGEK